MNIDYQKLIGELEERGMPVAALAETARLDGIRFASTSRLNQAFRSVNPLPLRDDVAQQIQNLWTEIESLQLWAYAMGVPFRLDFGNGLQVHEWLQTVRKWQRSEQQAEQGYEDTPSTNVRVGE